jgi:hypothetical protein
VRLGSLFSVVAIGAVLATTFASDAPASSAVASGSIRTYLPPVVTRPATNVGASGATLNGSVRRRGSSASAFFQWGTSTAYGHATPLKTLQRSGALTFSASTPVTGLTSGTTYHFRVVARIGGVTTYGADSTFRTTGTPPATCTPAWTSSEPLASWGNNGYQVNNNMWSGDAGPQTISACAWNRWTVVSNQPGTGTDDAVKTYPDTQRHVSLPLSSLGTLPSSFDVTTPAGGGQVPAKGKQWNAAYDLWLDDFGTEVMIWNNWTMNWQYWWDTYDGVQVTIDGVAYHAYKNAEGSAMWFIRDNVTNPGSVDLAHVLQWAVAQGWLKSTQVLGEVEYGFEVAYTGEPTALTLNNFTLSLP